jgi:hypothetical protein
MNSAGDWLSSIFTGKNKTLDSNINQFGQDAGVATTLGTGDATAASKEYQDILSGDPTKEAAAIAPETKAAQDQAAQAKKTTAEFGTRGGGTGGTLAGIDEATRSNLISLLGGLKTTAASGAASLGTAEQGLSLSDKQAQDAAAQQKLENEMNSILGNATSGAVNYAESFLPVPHGG